MTPSVTTDPGPALDTYCGRFRDVFPRADQFRRFRVYLAGLLGPAERKNVGGIAAAAGASAGGIQALQHFVSHSPWDAGRLMALVRAGLPRDPAALWVVHDAVFPKKGRHSVGVYRQYARPLGRKVNCQVAVAVSRIGPAGYYPLALRLYLPAGWLRDGANAGGVPDGHRAGTAKPDIAAELLAELASDEGPIPVAADPATAAATAAGFAGLNGLGLGDFEGRSWAGFHHHAAAVFAAHAFAAAHPAAAAVLRAGAVLTE